MRHDQVAVLVGHEPPVIDIAFEYPVERVHRG